MKLFVIGTPKAIYKLAKKIESIDKIKEKFPELELEFIAEPMVYMNCLDPDWSEERCDEMIYLLPESELPTRTKVTLN